MGRAEAFSKFFPFLLLEEAVLQYAAAKPVQSLIFLPDADYFSVDDEPAGKKEIQKLYPDGLVRTAFYFNSSVGGDAVLVFVTHQWADQQADRSFRRNVHLFHE